MFFFPLKCFWHTTRHAYSAREDIKPAALMHTLLSFLITRNQQSSRQYTAFGLFYIHRCPVANMCTQILVLNFIHLNSAHRSKRNVGMPNASADFHTVICQLLKVVLCSISSKPNVENFFSCSDLLYILSDID